MADGLDKAAECVCGGTGLVTTLAAPDFGEPRVCLSCYVTREDLGNVLDVLERLRVAVMPYVKEAAPGEQMNGEWCGRFDVLCDAVHDAESVLRGLGAGVFYG